MRVTYIQNRFIVQAPYEENNLAKGAGFKWDPDYKLWTSHDYRCAESLLQYCDQSAIYQIRSIKQDLQNAVAQSAKSESNISVIHPTTVKPYPYQIAGVEYMLSRPAVILADQMGLGKGLSINELIITPTGKKKISELKVGEKIIGSNGLPTKVIGIYPQGKKKLYRVTFNDGFSVLTDDQHLWSVQRRRDKVPLILSVGQLLDKKSETYYKLKNGDLKWMIPTVKPIHFKKQIGKLRVDPYVIGMLIANGILNKYLPEWHKYSSVEERLSILSGLINCVGKSGYFSVSKKMCDDVCEIVHSLGGIVRVKTKKIKGKLVFRLNIKLPKDLKLRKTRKSKKHVMPTKYLPSRLIQDIRFEKYGESVCIKVDAKDELFVANHGIVTHNTGQAFLVMNMRQNIEALIVCPSILKYNWLKEARKWLVGNVKAYIYESKKIRIYEKQLTPHNKQTTLHIINYDILPKFLERLLGTPFNFFVADESVYIKNPESNRTKVCQQLAKKAMWKIFITGTPIYNKPKDLYVPLNLIDPQMFGNAFQFYKRYCGAERKKFGKKQVVLFNGATNVDELNQILRANYMVRRMAKDVLKDLPDKIKDVIVLQEEDLSVIVEKEKAALGNSKKQQSQLQSDLAKLRELAQNNEAYKSIYNDKVKTLRESKFKSFGEISKIRKELAIKKVPYVIDFVKEHLESNEDPNGKIVVFGHHQEVLEAIYAALRQYKPVLVYGKSSDTDRQKAIKLFSEPNDCRVFIGSMGSAGSGVDGLQNHCNTMVFAELDWTPALVDQAESRLQRIGQKNTVWVYHIVADGSIDSRIAKIMVEKEELSRQILDYRPEQIYEQMIQEA